MPVFFFVKVEGAKDDVLMVIKYSFFLYFKLRYSFMNKRHILYLIVLIEYV